jgi:hypothetical protein
MLLTPPSPSTYIPPPHTRWHPGHVLSVWADCPSANLPRTYQDITQCFPSTQIISFRPPHCLHHLHPPKFATPLYSFRELLSPSALSSMFFWTLLYWTGRVQCCLSTLL